MSSSTAAKLLVFCHLNKRQTSNGTLPCMNRGMNESMNGWMDGLMDG